jgi:hypothetical protein
VVGLLQHPVRPDFCLSKAACRRGRCLSKGCLSKGSGVDPKSTPDPFDSFAFRSFGRIHRFSAFAGRFFAAVQRHHRIIEAQFDQFIIPGY